MSNKAIVWETTKHPTRLKILFAAAPTRKADGPWILRHAAACRLPKGTELIVRLIHAWGLYAAAHYREHGRLIGEDAVLGASWKRMGHELLVLLNGDLGRLDGGSLDHGIREFAKQHGVDLE